MILAARGGDHQAFSGAFDSSVPIPPASQYGGASSYAGKRVTLMSAAGLPAFMRGIRLLFETTAMMPAQVWRGYGSAREPQPDAPQLPVLRRPNDDMSPFACWAYVVASLLRGNAYLVKAKVPTGVVALYPLDPTCVRPIYQPGVEPTFELRQRGEKKTLTRAQVIHIPGILLESQFVGVSVIEAFRNGLGTALSRQEYEGRYLANDGTPGVVLSHAGNPGPDQRREMREGFEARHSGSANTGRAAMMWGGWELEKLAVSNEDAQFVESQQFSVQDIARMLGVPGGLLGDPEAPGNQTPEQENMRFLTYGLAPWMTRLEQGLALDRDLFPDASDQVELDPDFLLRADIKTRYEAYRLARQGGWITGNEIRTKEGLDEHPDANEIQQTPVGGAPNEDTNPAPEPEPAPTS